MDIEGLCPFDLGGRDEVRKHVKQFQNPTLAVMCWEYMGHTGPEATTPVPSFAGGRTIVGSEVAQGGPSSVQLRTGLMAVPVASLCRESMACASGNLS